jgi:hypothetical protein
MEARRRETAELYAALQERTREVAMHLLPHGKFSSNRNCYLVGNVQGVPGESLSIQLSGKHAGMWKDFATDEGGNLFHLWAAVRGYNHKTDFPALQNEIKIWLGYSEANGHPISHPNGQANSHPNGKPMANGIARPFFPAHLGQPTGQWDYISADDELLATVYRFDPPGKKKEYRPWDAVAGKLQAPHLRPLFNLPQVCKSGIVLLVEGEKCAQALIEQGICATTAMSGANTDVSKTDWSPLRGRSVYIWPDHDASGQHYAQNCAQAILAAGADAVQILKIPPEKPEKWDAADAAAEGINLQQFVAQAEWLPAAVPKPDISTTTLPAYSFGELLEDTSPMPEDIIAPRVLTPGGMLVFGGAPKVGKSDFLISLLAHMAAGEDFLGLRCMRPQRVFYLQAEVQYHYLRERIQKLALPQGKHGALRHNFVVTGQLRLILNETGLQRTIETIKAKFPDQPPDIIAIDPIRNVFDGGPSGESENDNNAMLFFLQERVEALRQAINPQAGIILAHHTRKASKRVVEEDPFQAFSGASSLRSFYTTGVLLLRPDESEPYRSLVFELRNGPGIPAKTITKRENAWCEVDRSSQRLVRQRYGTKLDAERCRQYDVLLGLIYSEGFEGRVYTSRQFSRRFANTHDLGAERTIRDRVAELVAKGLIRFHAGGVYGIAAVPRGAGYLCVEGMVFETEDQPLLPTHEKVFGTADIIPCDTPHTWPLLSAEDAS